MTEQEQTITEEKILTEKETQPQTQDEKEADKMWLNVEEEELNSQAVGGEKLPALQLEEGKISTFDIDFSVKFTEWQDVDNNCTKAIIPIVEDKESKVWWLNKKNPIYKDIIHAGREGQKTFKVMQTGTKKATKYNLVKE